MNNSLSALVRALRGPIMMATLGGLFAIDQGGGYSFSSTWPVLIIVFGVMKLAEAGLPKTPAANQGGM